MKIFLFVISFANYLLVQPIASFAQITFQKTFGGLGSDIGMSIQQTTDGGYVITGNTTSFGAGLSDVYLIKTDSVGNILWTKTYGGSGNDESYSVQQTPDGGYVVAGNSFSFGAGGSDVYLIKTDSVGNILWTKTYGGPNDDYGQSVSHTEDGGYIIAGTTISFGIGNSDVYLIKTDSIGNILWTRTYGSAGWDSGRSVCQSDGGYIVAGSTDLAVYLIKTDSIGDITWTKSYAGNIGEASFSVQETSDSGYIVVGYSASFGAGGYEAYLIKTNNLGDTLWTKTYGGGNFDIGYDAKQTLNGGFIIAGRTNSFGAGDYDAYLIRTNSFGDTLWTKTYGNINSNEAVSIQQTSDNGFVIAGFTGAFGDNNVLLIKTDANGNTVGCNEYGTSTVVSNTATQVSSGGSVGSGGISGSTATIVSNTATAVSVFCVDSCNITSSFTSSAINICEEETINFTNTSSGAISYEWQEDGIPFSTATDTARTFSTAGTYIISLIADSSSCSDSSGVVITVNPTYNINISDITICAGDSVQIFGFYQTTSGTYYDSLTTVNGCDSIIATNLIVYPTYSIITADETICNGDSILIFGIYRTTAGTYHDSLNTINGCDSVIITTLTVNPLPTINLGSDTIICNACTITLDAGAGFAGYNWSTGENTQTIIVDSAGTYTVQITDTNGCIGGDTIVINIASGINNQYSLINNQLSIYPNPTKESFTIETHLPNTKNGIIRIYGLRGELVKEYALKKGNNSMLLNTSRWAKGVYVCSLEVGGEVVQREKMVVE